MRGHGMELAALKQIGVCGNTRNTLGNRCLPLGFRRQPFARPPSEGLCLEVAHMTDGRRRDLAQGEKSAHGVDHPHTIYLAPVERRIPLPGVHCFPALGEPELGARIASVFHEGEILAASDGARCERKWLKKDSVSRRFVVVSEAVAGVTNLGESTGETAPAERRGAGLEAAAFRICGMQRVAPECMLDVVAEQLLVLLLVMDSQLDALGRCGGHASLVQAHDRVLHVLAVGEDLLDAGTREGGAQLFLWLIGDVVVIAVEEPEEVRMEWLVAVEVFAEDEGFEEPSGVGEMPFYRARLRTALHHHVFRSERARQREALASRCSEGSQEFVRTEFRFCYWHWSFTS